MLNESGLPRYHLRRVGPPATRAECASHICFYKVSTLVGRNRSQVDYVLCSTHHQRNASVSRRHARIVRSTTNSTHRLCDDSKNGIFVNDIKINDSAVLNEGDIVTFGHPNGERIPTGARVRQPDSEYQFIVSDKAACLARFVHTIPLHAGLEPNSVNPRVLRSK